MWKIRIRALVLLALAGLLACRSEDEIARDTVAQLFSEDADDASLVAVVDLGAAGVPHLVERIVGAPQHMSGVGVRALLQIGGRAVPALLRQLDSEDSSERRVALSILVWMGDQPSGEEAVRRFTECLGDDDSRIRRVAALGLAQQGQRPHELVPVLLDALSDPDPETRRAAVQYLRGYRHSISGIVEGLLSAADDAVPEVQQAAIASLAGYWSVDSRASTRVREKLASDEPTQRVAGIRALVHVEPPTSELPQLCLTAAEDEVESVQAAAVEAVSAIWRKRPMAYADHRTALRHSIPEVRRAACEAVEFSRAVGVREIQPLLADGAVDVRVAAANALGFVSEKDPAALAVLSALVADSDDDAEISVGDDVAVRVAAAWVLIERDHESTMAMRYLARNGYTLDLVKKYGPAAKPAAPEIARQLSRSKDRHIAWALYVVTGNSMPSIESLRGTLRHGDWFGALRASIHAARYGKGAAPLVPELRKLLDHEHDGNRRYAATALGYVGAAAKPAIPKLIELLDDHGAGENGPGGTYAVSRHAAAALACLDVESPKIEALVRKVLDEWDANDGNTRPGALRYAWKHGLRTPEQVAHACTESLSPPNWDDVLPILWLLEEMGPDAKSAIPALEEQLDKRWGIRLAAQRALDRIGPR